VRSRRNAAGFEHFIENALFWCDQFQTGCAHGPIEAKAVPSFN
jgi:hypothetical protein